MKKIVTVITLLLAFTISANAQSKKDSQTKKSGTKEAVITAKPSEAAMKDATMLTEYLDLNDTQKENFVGLFLMKHKLMQDPLATLESKIEMTRVVGLKISASIDDAQQKKLNTNPELLKTLTQNY